MSALCLRILAGILFKGDDLFAFNFESEKYLIDSHRLKFKLAQFATLFNHLDARMIFIFLDSFFYRVIYRSCL